MRMSKPEVKARVMDRTLLRGERYRKRCVTRLLYRVSGFGVSGFLSFGVSRSWTVNSTGSLKWHIEGDGVQGRGIERGERL